MKDTAFGEALTGWEGVSRTPEVNQLQPRQHHIVLTANGIGISCPEGAGTDLL